MENPFRESIQKPRVLGNTHAQYLEFLTTLVFQNGTPNISTPRIVIIRGQSGIGKTHIIRELYEWLVQRQDDPGYWPSLSSSKLLESNALDPFFLRKQIGPSPDHFIWRSGALPTFGWWSISCQRSTSPSIGQSLANLERQMNAHLLPLSLSWAKRVGLWGELLSSVKVDWQDRLQEFIREGTLEGLTGVLANLGITVPGFGLAVEYAAAGIRALSRRGVARRALEAQEELPLDSTVKSIVEQMRRFASTNFPMIVAIEDLQWADEGVVELLTRLVLEDKAPPGLTVIATSWPEAGPDSPCARLLGHLQRLDAVRYLDLHALEPQALRQLVLHSAPRTDSETVDVLTSRWPNPYALKLALADRRIRTKVVDEAYVLSRQDLDHLPLTIADLYRSRWRELPELERIVLAVGAASGLRDELTCNVTFSDAVTAKVIEETDVGRTLIADQAQRSLVLAVLDRTEDPLRWTRSTPDATRVFIEPDAANAAREELSQKEIDKVIDATRATTKTLLLTSENPTIATIYLQYSKDDANTHETRLARLVLARTYFETERYAEAAALFESVAMMQHSDPTYASQEDRVTALNLAGHSHLRAGNFEKAAAAFRSSSIDAAPAAAIASTVSPELLSGLWVTTQVSVNIASEALFQLIRHNSSDAIGVRVWAKECGTGEWIELVDDQTTAIQMSNLSSDLDIRIEYKNQTDSTLRNNSVRAYFNEGIQYVGRSIYLKNATHSSGKGKRIESSIISSTEGLNIGDYTPKSNALIYFSISLQKVSVTHHIVVDIDADYGRSIITRSFRVTQSEDCTSTPVRLPRYPWGPKRPVFNIDGSNGFPKTPIFNSIHNNPNYGDERQFVIVKDSSILTAGHWQEELQVVPGHSYKMRIYINNSASDRAAVAATNTRVKAIIPKHPGMSHMIWGLVMADNSSPEHVWSSAFLHAKQPVTLTFISGSARLYNNVRPREGFLLPDSIATNDGALIGYTDIDGVILPGYQYSSIVTLQFSVHAAG